jgi:hypothetical protein
VQPHTQHHAETGEPGGGAGDPHHHTGKVSVQFAEMIDRLSHDIDHADEPQLKAMLETAVAVLGRLAAAFRRYEQKSEHTWKQARNS